MVENVDYGDTNVIPQKLKKVVLGGAGTTPSFGFWSKLQKNIFSKYMTTRLMLICVGKGQIEIN